MAKSITQRTHLTVNPNKHGNQKRVQQNLHKGKGKSRNSQSEGKPLSLKRKRQERADYDPEAESTISSRGKEGKIQEKKRKESRSLFIGCLFFYISSSSPSSEEFPYFLVSAFLSFSFSFVVMGWFFV